MKLLLNAGTGFALAAWFLGTGLLAGFSTPHWDVVRADLAAAHPRQKLAAQLCGLFPAGTPRPATPACAED